ncbi:MAG: response regulator transcription factor [Trueperaceae bacterium]|nr:response regulator transcription factor [Trueperaceae bacterium]
MTRGRILFIEDDGALRDLVARELRTLGYEVIEAGTGGDGLGEAALKAFDLAVLDLNLPDMDGLEVAERLRDDEVPILMLTARTDVDSRVAGLYAGASDYVPKPFDVRELVARVHVRMRESAGSDVLEYGSLRLQVETRTLRAGGREVVLPEREAELLRLLLAHPGKVFTRDELERRLYDGELPESNTVQVFVSQVRRKLADLGENDVIQTVRGKGYTVA